MRALPVSPVPSFLKTRHVTDFSAPPYLPGCGPFGLIPPTSPEEVGGARGRITLFFIHPVSCALDPQRDARWQKTRRRDHMTTSSTGFPSENGDVATPVTGARLPRNIPSDQGRYFLKQTIIPGAMTVCYNCVSLLQMATAPAPNCRSRRRTSQRNIGEKNEKRLEIHSGSRIWF
ncbi:hypothetical protein DPEC_G00055890 [Dallia pectoralis]|uniref:Uncharacterized protein n=1 Tax=Dallia pectoralis TaxID=75939 RepID=A0ACC2H5J2_DALPE|nr:hypothetical protein DPEC_G00055890 [Dallia pectoralis]